MIRILNIFTDGGARGNPGEGAIGVYMEDENKKQIAGFGKKIGISTNNTAEYRAVLAAYSWVFENRQNIADNAKISFFLDSRLVCFQLKGLFKIKNKNLQELFFSIKEKERSVGIPVTYHNVPREQNKKADGFVNQALDNCVYLDNAVEFS